MPEHKHTIFTKQAGEPKNQDRCTVVITGHYQEWDPSNTTHFRVAYDRLVAPDATPLQTAIRINPGRKVAVPLGMSDPGKCELLLAHDVAKLQKDSNPALVEAQAQNIIKITNTDGVVLGMIYPDRGCLFHFAGEVFAESTHATAILKITVFPA